MRSMLNNKFEFKTQFQNQKLEFIPSRRINSRCKINFTLEESNMLKLILTHLKIKSF